LAVARNCGIGSSCLNAEEEALDSDQNVRGNSSFSGEVQVVDWPRQVLGHFQVGLDESTIDGQFRNRIAELGFLVCPVARSLATRRAPRRGASELVI